MPGNREAPINEGNPVTPVTPFRIRDGMKAVLHDDVRRYSGVTGRVTGITATHVAVLGDGRVGWPAWAACRFTSMGIEMKKRIKVIGVARDVPAALITGNTR